MREIVHTPSASPAPSPYSHIVRSGDLLFVSGQVAMNLLSGELQGGDILSQTRAALVNLEILLRDAGASLDDVIKTTVYLTDFDRDIAGLNAVYREVFPVAPPARATLGIARLAGELVVEIEAIAAAPSRS